MTVMSKEMNRAAPGDGVDLRNSPYCTLRRVPLRAGRWSPGFRADRFAQ